MKVCQNSLYNSGLFSFPGHGVAKAESRSTGLKQLQDCIDRVAGSVAKVAKAESRSTGLKHDLFEHVAQCLSLVAKAESRSTGLKPTVGVAEATDAESRKS